MVKPTTTPKALVRILNGELVENPILQVLAYKKVTDGATNQTKFRFILSDGDNMHQCCIMASEPLVNRVEAGEFERYTVIKLIAYNCNDVKGNKVRSNEIMASFRLPSDRHSVLNLKSYFSLLPFLFFFSFIS